MLNSLMEKLASVEYCDLLDRILCAIPEHVYAVDRQGKILYTNLALSNAWGIGRSEMIGATFRDVAHPRSAVERFERMLEAVCETGRQATATFAVPYRSLGARDIQIVLTPAFENDGMNVKFVVGVAGAPVTHWDGYDTAYTERYMSTPAANPTGYRESSVLAHVEDLCGKLLIVHGMIDENVHFRHTARLVVALAAAGKPYDILVFPEERHMPRDADGLEYQERRVLDYFLQHL